jgi:late competence protein required for DNA uptake (superfamily II DNA/RNA helicase)
VQLVKNNLMISFMEKISEDVFEWSMGEGHGLNLVTIPFNNILKILNRTITNCINNNEKVIYITNEETEDIGIIEALKINIKDFLHFRNCDNECEGKMLVTTNHEDSILIFEKFDLVIYDNINCFSDYSNNEILDIMGRLCKENGKLIACSYEPVFKNSINISFPIMENGRPFVEPRNIITRIDLNNNIPSVIYEFLKWSLSSERKVIIYAPHYEKARKIFEYILSFKEEFNKDVFIYLKEDMDLNKLKKFTAQSGGILITDCLNKITSSVKDLDVMVFFAEDKTFNYKKLLYICGKVGRSEFLTSGEVIFVASTVTEDMEKAKNLARNINKEAWEIGLLKF